MTRPEERSSPAKSGFRVMHVIHSGALGGGPEMVKSLASAADGNRHLVVSSDDGPLLRDVVDLGIEAHEVQMSRKRDLLEASWSLRRTIRSWSPDVVICRGQFAGFVGALASRLGRSRVIYVCAYPSFYADRDRLTALRHWIVEFVSCRSAAVVVMLNDGDAATYVARRLANPRHAHLIRNGIDVDLFAPSPLPAETARIGFVGRLVRDKGADTLIDAVALLPDHLRRGLEVVVVGGGPDLDALRLRAESIIKGTPDAVPDIRFLGEVRATQSFFSQCSIVAVPSRREPFGIVALEALACGVPVVASRVGGLAETIDHNRTGILVQPDSAGALANALRSLLEDRALRTRLGSAGRRDVVARFSTAQMRDEYARLYLIVSRHKQANSAGLRG